MGAMRGSGFNQTRYAAGYFTGNSITVDKRRSGFPCRADLNCRFISSETAPRNAHELDVHHFVNPTSPNATAGGVPVVAFRARSRRTAHISERGL